MEADACKYIPWEEAVNLLKTPTKDVASGHEIEMAVQPDNQPHQGKRTQ